MTPRSLLWPRNCHRERVGAGRRASGEAEERGKKVRSSCLARAAAAATSRARVKHRWHPRRQERRRALQPTVAQRLNDSCAAREVAAAALCDENIKLAVRPLDARVRSRVHGRGHEGDAAHNSRLQIQPRATLSLAQLRSRLFFRDVRFSYGNYTWKNTFGKRGGGVLVVSNRIPLPRREQRRATRHQ